eukprot:CAMPEP_0119507856 /NCGR_PEP_ID=MMETSP1344-20130328/27636_1 /TAXON_ID=236787 /ORGANISM="Florenciella parvula, Strain CCMP2471" /LENGTH=95 /DNA_ID=CAMNT_0007544527 /DNA_START=39 /DNA_END=326 /DNA_ORIENTATION=+
MEDTLGGMGRTLTPEIFPAGTDSRFLRALGIPCFGFSPLSNSPVLLHEHNEYVHEAVFIAGISVYEQLLPALLDSDVGVGMPAADEEPSAKRAKA